jgi:hypothetical protein
VLLPREGRVEVTFGQLTPGTQTLTRDHLEARYSLDIPGNLQPLSNGTYIELVARSFPEDAVQDAVLEVSINGQSLPAVALAGEDASERPSRLEPPARFLQAGPNLIAVRLRSDTLCKDPETVLTVEIDERSLLSFGYRQEAYPIDLARYPLPFAEKSLFRIPITLVLPERPSGDNLSAAMTLAAGLGQASGGTVDLRAIAADKFDSDLHSNHHLIVLGLPDTNAMLRVLDPTPSIESSVTQAGQGFLQLIVSPWNEYRLLLMISGADDRGILNAIHVLNLDERFPPIRGASAVVPGFRPPASQPEVGPPRNMSLGSLGMQDETIYGARHQERTIEFALPPGWQFTGTPELTLRFSHSNILDPRQSVMDVRLNGQPVGSVFLNGDNAIDGEWTVALPQGALQAGNNQLLLEIEMILPRTDDAARCELLHDERLWTVISAESELSLPYEIVDFRPYLEYLPYPYGQRSGLGQSLFVLPDQPDTLLVSDLLRLGAHFGALTDADYLPAHVTYASEADRKTWQDAHLVLVGRATQHALLREFNAYLPRPFAVGPASGETSEESDVLSSVVPDDSAPPTPVAFELDPERDTGVLQTVRSPWNQRRAVLSIAGTTGEGVHLAVRALLESAQDLEGNIAIVDRVSPTADQITLYATDTRPAGQTPGGGTQGSGSPGQGAPDPNTILLAQRWWK